MKRAISIVALLLCLLPAQAQARGPRSNCEVVGEVVRHKSAVTGHVRLFNFFGVETSVQPTLAALGRRHQVLGEYHSGFRSVPIESHVDYPFKIRLSFPKDVRSVVVTNCAVRVESTG